MCGCNGNVAPSGATQINRVMTNNAVRPTVQQMAEAQPFFSMVASANPDAVRSVLVSHGFNVQGLSTQAIAGFMYQMYAAGQFDPQWLDGILVGSVVDGKATAVNPNAKTVFDDNKTWEDWVGDIGGVIGSVFGTGSGLTQSQPQAPDNSQLIAGMQRSTMYLIVGVMVIVIGLILFLAFRKK